ncbi:cobalamin-binding protein [Chitinilyticum litopenaei]|uniref:Cobalamin-binding protein n=2 Tax=Chitinilyticum piscinae TaxID=2866724 RepID=A0A8J7G2T0_9NEIS|nr:cobalamin-binding protein [Chitinilyticum piscinae]
MQVVATACLVLLLTPLRAAPVTVADDLGRLVSLSEPARRIVSLAPHVTEDLFAIGAGEWIVGAVDYSDYPPAARRIARVGGYSGFDLERIRSLRPDLIVAWGTGNPDRQLQQILRMGIPVYISQAERLEDIPVTLLRLGQLTGQQAVAQKAAGAYRTQLQQLHQRYAQRTPVRVFYQVWQRPLMTINGRQYISDALRTCGAVNVFADARALVPTVDVEAVVAARPQAIISSGGEEGDPLGSWRQWRSIPAVQHGQLHVLPKDILVRMGPRLVEGTAALCAAVEQARQALPSR